MSRRQFLQLLILEITFSSKTSFAALRNVDLASLYLFSIASNLAITMISQLNSLTCGSLYFIVLKNMNHLFILVCGSKISVYKYTNNQLSLYLQYNLPTNKAINELYFLTTTINNTTS